MENETTYYENPYNINTETGLYEEITARYRKIIDSLNLSKKFAKSSMITGELRAYYESTTNGSEIDQNIDDIIKELENIIVKIEVSLKTYEEIDESLRKELDSIIGTIFELDEIKLGDSKTTIEERKENLENIIKNFEDALRIWKEEYNSLFKVDEKDTDKIFHLFDSLGLTQFSKEAIYNKETGSYNIKKLEKMVNYLEKNNVSKIFHSYFKEDKSWQESGMATFDENLKRDYWLYRNNNGYSEESNKNLDAEVLFLQNFMNSFGTNAGKTPGVIEGIDNLTSHVYLYGIYCQEKYQGLKYFEDYFYTDKKDLQLNENFNLSFEEWLKEWEGTQEEYYITHQNELQLEGYNTFDEYLKVKKNTDSETSLDLITSCFSFGENINGKYHFWYELNTEEGAEWTKESALIMIKSYVANQGGLEILDEASDIYDKKAELDKNIMSLQNTIYNYKQYSKLMIFDDDKKNEKYLTKYLTKNYDASYNNKFLPEEWLQYLDRSEVALLDYLYNEKDEYQAKKYVDAITDIVNQRKGFKEAVEYAESLNKENKFDENFANSQAMMNGDAGSYAASGLIWLVNKLFPDQVDKVIDTGIAGTEGFFDGNYNFIDGFYDMVNADGVRSAKDYEFMYKMQLLATNNEYTTNLTDKEKEWLNSVYQFGNSLGYMTIPTLLIYIPVVGNTLSYGALTISSSGNSAEDLMQQGVEKERAYLFGSLMGVSETAVEKLIGGLPGSPENAGKGFLSLIKSSLGEAGEEAFQTYVSSGISSMATGEPFDVGSVTEEAKEAAFMAIFTSGFMNTGGSIFLKVADTVIETTPSKYNSYEEWRASIENDFRKNNSDIANNLMETQADTGELILNIPQEELNNIDGKQKEMISNLVYNTKTGEYQVTLISGNTFAVDNLDKVTNNVLVSNLRNTNVSDGGLVQKTNDLLKEQSDEISVQDITPDNIRDAIKELKITETPNKVDNDISAGLDIDTPSQYSDYSLDQIINYQKIKDTFNKLFDLAQDEKTKSKLEEILYKGGIDGFSFSTKLSNSDNPSVEGQRRIAMANLLVTHPDTFNTLVENKINVFHGTSSAVLSSILTHGLNSGLESQQNGIDVLTGEEWSRGGEQRSFVSFTDLLDMAKGYSAVSTSKSKNDSDFEVVIATTTDDIKQEKLVRIHSDTPEIGVKSKLPSDKIKAIMVPSDKVEVVKSMIKDANIKVLAVDDSKDKFYSVDDMGLINISDDKFNKLKSTISQTTIDQQDNIESKEATDEQADEFVGPITIPNTLNEINKALSSNLPTNYYKGNISISNNVYNIPIIHSDSSLDYSIVDLYPASHYIRVYADKGNIEQQIRAQLADISQKNNNQEQPNTTIDANTNSPEFIATTIDGETIPPIQEVGIKEVVSSNEENFENQTENVEPQVETVTPTLQKGQPTNDEFKQVTFDSDVATDNVIIEPKVNEIQGTIVEQSNIKRDISLNSDVIRSIAHLNNSEVISKNSFSKTVADFIKRLDSDVSKLISSPNVMMPSTHSINPIIDSYGMYDSTYEVRNVSIADIISSGQLKQDTNILSTFDDYFNTYDKNADSYHTRANSLLSYSNGESLINGIKNFSDTLDMKIREYQDGTYIIGSNGLHRYTILRFFYQLDLANGADVETLREKYTFPMTVTEKINYDNTFIKYFSHKLFDDLTWFTLDDETMSNSEPRYKMFFKQDGGTKVIEMERSEILAKISDALQNKEKKYFSFLEFKENYLKYNNFQKFVDDNFPDLKNIILSFNEMPTFIDMEQDYIVDNIGFGANNSLADENNHVDVLDVPSLDDMIFDYEFVQPEQPFIDRNLVINEYSKSEFMDFLENDNSGQILKILDDEGLKILNNSRKKEERIRYILTHSKYKNELFINEKFLDIFLNTNVTSYYAVLSGLSFETYDKILERCIEGNFGNYIFVELFGFFDIDYQLKALENWKYSSELIYDVFKKFNIPVVKRILENYNINLLSHDINLEDLFYCAKESVLRAQASRYEYGEIIDEIKIPVNMVTNEMASILWNKYDIFRLRKIVNDANYSTDPSILNEYIKIQEEKIISEVLEKKMTTQFLEIFNTFEKIKNLAYNDLNRYNLLEKYHELLISMNMMNENQNLERIYKNGGIDKVRDYLQKLSDRAVSNYIIDYHFEENFYNIMIDVRELLKFYNDGNINLSLERVELYQKIANIDSLSVLEKVELHNQLKNVAIMELFYDDMSLAREIVGEAIRDYSLTYESLKQYRNEHLSSQYGIDVYTIEDNPFFAVVKSNRRAPDLLPTGHSYSLIGYGGISVFGNVKDSSTFLYDSVNLKPEQIVHTFPYDSYTLYRPFRFNENATDRINLLMMPEELMANTETYNEILILERGKLSTEMDEAIPELKRMALYCIDEITEKDIKAAEIAGVGIFLVNSKNYYNPDDASLRNYQRHIDYYNSNYFDGVNKQKIEDNR